MTELSVDTAALGARSASFKTAGEDHARAGALDPLGVEADIAAFGEINTVLHDGWRTLKARQSEAWQGLGQRHIEHGDKLSSAAVGYSTTEENSTRDLSVADTE